MANDILDHIKKEPVQELPLSPWQSGAEPFSRIYPHLKSKRIRRHLPSLAWPYKDSNYLYWWQHTGYGAPPTDMPAWPGDLWIDLTPSPGPKCLIYYCNSDNGKKWLPLNQYDANSVEGQPLRVSLVPHPYHPKWYLWGCSARGIGWLSEYCINKEASAWLNGSKSPKFLGNPKTMVDNVLSGSKKLDYDYKQHRSGSSRLKEEQKRRGRASDSSPLSTLSPTPTSQKRKRIKMEEDDDDDFEGRVTLRTNFNGARLDLTTPAPPRRSERSKRTRNYYDIENGLDSRGQSPAMSDGELSYVSENPPVRQDSPNGDTIEEVIDQDDEYNRLEESLSQRRIEVRSSMAALNEAWSKMDAAYKKQIRQVRQKKRSIVPLQRTAEETESLKIELAKVKGELADRDKQVGELREELRD